ncbi:MAG: hypothetical protein QOD81_780 [Solirubrobacteraceae bacterium]|nr:hypothetical protein [Solirubrobacteraceae bacterium]
MASIAARDAAGPVRRPPARRVPRGLALPAVAVICGAALGAVLLGRPLPYPVYVGLAGLIPVAALVLAGGARAAAVTGALVYGGVLAWVYRTQFVPLFAYQGLIDARPDEASLLVVVVLAAVPAAWLPVSASRPSSIVLWSLYVVGFVPAIVIPIFLARDLEAVLPLALTLLGAMAILRTISGVPSVPIMRDQHLSPVLFTRLVTTLSLATSVYVVVSFGLHALPSLGDVYTARTAFGSAIGGGAWPAGYVVPWAGNAVNPLLMALGLSRRRADLFAVGLVGQLLIYSDTGFKSVLFSTALLPLVYLAIAVARRSYGIVVVATIPIVLVLATIGNAATANWSLTLVRRQFATPGQLNWYYFDFFGDHSRDHLSASFLRAFFSRPYSSEPADLIGQVYLPAEHPHANAGVWADAFANFGFGGIAVFTVVLGIVLWVLDGLSWRRDVRLIGPMLAIAGLTLSEGALFTSLLSLGLGVACALIALAPPAPGGDDPMQARPDGAIR